LNKARVISLAVTEQRGKVYLVGAGPGAPDLITVRGAEVIRNADTIVYDYLASADILQMAPSSAERVYAGKIGTCGQQFEQAAINHILIDHARAGKRVARLKGGDPFIFGRGGEEAEALVAAGIDFEIVPGVTSATAVPAFGGIPLTHRQYGSFVVFVTGHQGAEKNSTVSVPWEELAHAARGRGTIVILMATAHIHENLVRLMAGGLASDTPSAAIQWGTTAAQKTVTATIATLADEVERAALGAPAVVVVGECARFASILNWVERLPLFGRRIVTTRAAAEATRFASQLRQLGAEAIEFPTIATIAPDNYSALDTAIGRIRSFDWIVFTSATGVEAFLERLRKLNVDIRTADARIAAIGPATAARLRHYALTVSAIPHEYRAEAIIDALGERAIAGARILIPRAQIAREILPRHLREKGAREVVVAPAYRTVAPQNADVERIRQLIAAGAIDLVTFTSSSTVNHFRAMLGEEITGLKAATIGPITAETARATGFNVVVSPDKYTVDSLLDAILRYFRGGIVR
jgi:uroporphyrinogen III methyltransferase / synthase